MDCLGWFRYWSKVHFGVDIFKYDINHERLTQSAAKAMVEAENIFGYARTITPKEGDAVYLSQRVRAHHLGMYLVIDSHWCVLHALEGVGVIISDRMDLAVNGWKITEYRTHAN